MLLNNKVLKELSLKKCNIDDSVVTSLSEGLKYNKSLAILNLSNNLISDFGAIILSESI